MMRDHGCNDLYPYRGPCLLSLRVGISPADLIPERARKSGCSLILMGTQGRGFLNELFLGSVSHNVARRVPLPVLFVPALREMLSIHETPEGIMETAGKKVLQIYIYPYIL